MAFVIKADKYDLAYAEFLRDLRLSVQSAFAEEAARRTVSETDFMKWLAKRLNLGVQETRERVNGQGQATLKIICDLYTAMGREPLDNLRATPGSESSDRS